MEGMGYKCIFVSPYDGPLRIEIEKRGVPSVIISEDNIGSVILKNPQLFDIVVINTFALSEVVSKLNGTDEKVLWWLHDPKEIFAEKASQVAPDWMFPNVTIATVGDWNRYSSFVGLHNYKVEELTYCLPNMIDKESRELSFFQKKEDMLFSIIGPVEERTGQDTLVKAIIQLPEEVRKSCRFDFVGRVKNGNIYEKIVSAKQRFPDRIQYIPDIKNDERNAYYESIDCLICASKDIPLPVETAEACQKAKLIICSDDTELADLIRNYDAGLIYQNNSVDSLSKCIETAIKLDNKSRNTMKKNARKLYDEVFSIEAFKCKLNEILKKIHNIKVEMSYEEKVFAKMQNKYKRDIYMTKKEVSELKRQKADLSVKLHLAKDKERIATDKYNSVSTSTIWAITKPARTVADVLKASPSIIKTTKAYAKKGLLSVKQNGFRYTIRKVKNKLSQRGEYDLWLQHPLFTEEQLDNQRSELFSKDICFSILVPLFNTPDAFLREMIDSVVAQTYSKWELCLADGSDDNHTYVGKICMEYAEKDERIKYRKLTKNMGISGNTNACIEMATGDYIALFDHDDILHPAALHEMMIAICEKDADFIYTDEATFESPNINALLTIHFKPDYSPDNLRANNYICHFTAFQRSLIDITGGFRSEYDGSQDHDLQLRLTSVAQRIVHIPEVLYYWRSHPQSVASNIGAKEYAVESARRAVIDSLKEKGIVADVESTRAHPCIFHVIYEILGNPKISIIIPNCDQYATLKKCIDSILINSTYNNYEIIIVENNSKTTDIFDYYRELEDTHSNIKIISWNGSFNYSAINNYGIREAANGDYVLLLNNDTEIISPNWMEEMLMYAQREDVGAVGAMLYYPNNTIQHAGVILGLGGVAGHSYSRAHRGELGYMGRLCYAQNMSAVTAACMMIRKKVWDEVNGLDEDFPVALNDVDLCMKIRKAGYLIVWTPFAELYHYESLSRGSDSVSVGRKRFDADIERFKNKWKDELQEGDPYYNPNLTLKRADFSLKISD